MRHTTCIRWPKPPAPPLTDLQVAKAQAIAKSESHRSPGQEVLMQQVHPLRI